MRKRLVLPLLVLFVFGPAAFSAPLYFDTWTPFTWDNATSNPYTSPGSALDPFILDLTGSIYPVEVRVTDRGFTGDSFDIFVNGALLYQTPTVPNLVRATIPASLDANDPANALTILALIAGGADPLYIDSLYHTPVGWNGAVEWAQAALSHGSFILAPGFSYNITIQLRDVALRPTWDPDLTVPPSPYYLAGGGFIEAIHLPEPATFGVIGLALTGLALFRRRRSVR